MIRILKKYGFLGCCIKFMNKLTYRIFRFFNVLDVKNETKRLKRIELEKKSFIERKIKDKKYKYVFVFYPYAEWNLPIFQRPHQIALELSKKKDVLYLFCTANCHYDNLEEDYEEINPNLYIVKDYEAICNVKTDKRIIHLYSTDTLTDYSVVEEAHKRKDKVLYEYIDEIHEEITHRIPKFYLEKHKKILKDKECYVVTTADKLYEDVKKYRKKRYTLATNGVNINDFISNDNYEAAKDLFDIKKNYKKVILYYGALATWFDYDLIKKTAKRYPEYAIVLIGLEYDDSFQKSKVLKLENVYYLGKKNYYDLYKYSKNSDLLIIPFLINEITESTSPVKIFEYMAAGIPILTTNMKECRKYKSVVIGLDHKDFIEKIESTMELKNDKDYLELEFREALDNTWSKKTEEILKILND